MAIEAATFISDLVPANPSASDLVSQGDDHIRLEKQVLQNTFPNASKAFYFPTGAGKNANFTVAVTDMHKTFGVDAGTVAGIIMTLPPLGAGDAGWECTLIKFSGTVPVFVTPASGTVFSGGLTVPAARRSIIGVPIKCFWTGSAWNISRAIGVPIGTCLEYHGSTLPVGYEWPNGQTFASPSSNYPEYFTAFGSGTTLDKRGRVGIALDNLGGSAAGRLAGGVITGTGIGNTGGVDTVTLGASQIPGINVSVSGSNSFSVTSSANVGQGGTINTTGTPGTGTPVTFVSGPGLTLTALNSSGSVSITSTGASTNTSGGAHSNLQPSIMVGEILVVE